MEVNKAVDTREVQAHPVNLYAKVFGNFVFIQ